MMKKILSTWGVHIGIVAFAVFWLAIVAANLAESAELSDSTPQSVDDAALQRANDNADSDYNFNWLDPEKKIYVLQNRRYTKANRAMLSILVGPASGNPYRTVFNIEPRLSYYFSESWGIEGFYTKTSNSPNGNFTSFQNTVGGTTIPFIREFKNEVGAMASWIPWYAKINVFNSILYFDWYFNLGLGSISSQNFTQATTASSVVSHDESFMGIYWGTGHLYHLSQNWTVRLDITSAIYHAANDPNGDKTWYSNYNFGVGLGYRF